MLGTHGITANQVTLAAAAVSLLVAALVYRAGHGGVRDRLASVCVAAPVLFLPIRYGWA